MPGSGTGVHWEVIGSGAVLAPNGAVGGTIVPGDFSAQAVSQGTAGSYQVQFTGAAAVGEVVDTNIRLQVFLASGSQPGGKGAVCGIAAPGGLAWNVAFWNQTADAAADVPFTYEIKRKVIDP